MTKAGFHFLPIFFVLFRSENLGTGLWRFVAPALTGSSTARSA